ncbi:MAG: hypothetical protein JW986_06925 [Methanotrichaceae archaeon]|nr:hypothetical protein [Methanotrichaceae archaeon]
MMRARLTFRGPWAPKAARSLAPDNLPDMVMDVRREEVVVELSADKPGRLLSTVDDLLMNMKIAEETLNSSEVL